MATAAHSVEIALGPGFIASTFFRSSDLSGPIEECLGPLKLTIGAMFLWDCAHTATFLGTFWHLLLSCRRSTSSDCLETFTSWETILGFIASTVIAYSAQSFYVYRVWIISGKNYIVTGVVVGTSHIYAVLKIVVFGLLSAKLAVKSRDWQVMFSSPYPALSAGSGSLCDVLITISIAYFLRTRSEPRRQDNYIRQLKVIFVEMGLMSCIISTLVAVTLALPDVEVRQHWALAPGPLQTKIYVNSMLAVLNARKVIRQRQVEGRGQILGKFDCAKFSFKVPADPYYVLLVQCTVYTAESWNPRFARTLYNTVTKRAMATAVHCVEIALGPGFIASAFFRSSDRSCTAEVDGWDNIPLGLCPYRLFALDILALALDLLPQHFSRLSRHIFQMGNAVYILWNFFHRHICAKGVDNGRNNLVTGVVCLVAVFQILFGLLSAKTAVKSRDWQVMFSSPYPALSAGSGSLCDVLITISIAYFLRSRSQMRRQDNYIRQLKVIFVETGLMSCIISTLVTVTLALPDFEARQNWAPAPGPLQTKSQLQHIPFSLD
ncbi:hypothetical protein AZE42_11735 [Rhizopogon vesiculosus]|uniref:DUF6534 domain-containing protein n=1 Tax=Rhizopogon vesiculosus TaxID=180088 RepID=A0A1J8QYC3_9AGAM|nr:hypothetical protein AZE42_11735 [Rhizopogon vesiculosus]